MLVTVAICTWNRSQLLNLTLQELTTLRIPKGVQWRLLVVNNNCRDDTDSVIRRYEGALPIERLFEPKPGLSNARNCALAEARGEWIVWTDDDVLIDPDWLVGFSETVDRFPNAAAVGGPIAPWFPVEPDPDLAAAFPIILKGFCGLDWGHEERPLSDREYLFGANMAFHLGRTEGLRFDPACGRREHFQGGEDDLDFVRRVRARGGSVIWSPRMTVRHYVEPSRMTVDYMDRWFTDLGEFTVQRDGIPPGTRLFGMPRWLVRRYIEWYAKGLAARLPLRRVAHLKARQEYCYVRGLLRGCLRASASRVNGTSGATRSDTRMHSLERTVLSSGETMAAGPRP